ncbi:DUF3073 domain-containing protein [Alloscardovia macacae]|uniref:DUF3073 domain-containing protein n=1 Tax=Alloscardovia macacae TaxID=1160091 RepID=A0A261F6D9_9BIFI|nr:DUF3073 domain-containing protein [Alloscardovia macacae]OZG54707.1 hypothetical protein ALMA_0032 [Alloscardovia macacae]
MGRGRQKAKQTKIARKLKYLTTDTDYDELAKELSHHDDVQNEDIVESAEPVETVSDASVTSENTSENTEDLDDYAAWAAQAAKRAEEKPAVTIKPHKPFPKMPVPGMGAHKN